MRVLLIHNFYQRFGGEDAVALAESQLLKEHGNEVITYTRHNNEINNFNVCQKLSFVANTIYSLRSKRDTETIVSRLRPDVAYIHNVYPLISPSIYDIFHSRGIPIVQVTHDFRFMCPNGWFYNRGKVCEDCRDGNYVNAVRHRCYRNSYVLSTLYATSIGLARSAGVLKKINAFVCLTAFTKLKLQEVGIPEDRLFVKPNFIDADCVAPSSGSGEYVLYLGRLSPEKGVWTLVRAFKQLQELRLKIMGTGPLEDALRQYVRDKGLANVDFMGFKRGAEKWDLLKGSFLVVVPSEWYETFCLTVLEAYAAGKPVLASNLGSLPYVIENAKSGLLFEPGNVNDLANKIRRLRNRPTELAAMGRYARNVVETRYNPTNNYTQLMEIFSRVCQAC